MRGRWDPRRVRKTAGAGTSGSGETHRRPVLRRGGRSGRDAEKRLLSRHVINTVLAAGLVLGLMLALAADHEKKVAGETGGLVARVSLWGQRHRRAA